MSGVPMLPPLAALMLFAVWAMVLVVSIGAWRLVASSAAGQDAPAIFRPARSTAATPIGGSTARI